jgi:hypothetical protein
VRYSARHQARLDAETHAKLQELMAAFQKTRAAILRYVMEWGISRSANWRIDQSIPAQVHLVPLLVEPELLQQAQATAAAHGMSVAAWLREAMRRITAEDFPVSWRAGEMAGRSHESGSFHQKFWMRLVQLVTIE